jgi:hypothetical protein
MQEELSCCDQRSRAGGQPSGHFLRAMQPAHVPPRGRSVQAGRVIAASAVQCSCARKQRRCRSMPQHGAAWRSPCPGLRRTALPRRGAAATDLRARLRGCGGLRHQGQLLQRRALSERVARALRCSPAPLLRLHGRARGCQRQPRRTWAHLGGPGLRGTACCSRVNVRAPATRCARRRGRRALPAMLGCVCACGAQPRPGMHALALRTPRGSART